MAPRPWHTRIRIEGVPLGAGTDLGIEERHADQQSYSKRHTWRGRPKIFGPRHKRLAVITLSCTDRLPPAWEHLRIGDEVSFQSSKHQGARIPAGLDNVVLRYPPCPDPTKACGYAILVERADTGAAVPFTVAGKTVTIAPVPGSDVKVSYRPIYPCEVFEIDDGGATETEGRQSWGLTLLVMA